MTLRKKKLLRMGGIVLAVLLVALAVTIAWLWWESHQRRQRAEEMFRDLQALKIGETSAQEAMKLVRKYGGTVNLNSSSLGGRTENTRYDLSWIVSPMQEMRLSSLFYKNFPLSTTLNTVGVRPWMVSASIVIESDRLVSWNYGAIVGRSDGSILGANVRVEAPWPQRGSRRADFGPSKQPSYQFIPVHHTGSPGESLLVLLTHEATPEERWRAFDINLGCLTNLPECRRACEFMPSVYRARVEERRTEGWKPLQSEANPVCRVVLAAGE
ncbi:MAG: hypothetical protein ACE5G6_01430 [Terriglobia bacterium]